jgi:hypothetical protein
VLLRNKHIENIHEIGSQLEKLTSKIYFRELSWGNKWEMIEIDCKN